MPTEYSRAGIYCQEDEVTAVPHQHELAIELACCDLWVEFRDRGLSLRAYRCALRMGEELTDDYGAVMLSNQSALRRRLSSLCWL